MLYPFNNSKSAVVLAGAALALMLGGASTASAQTFTFLDATSKSKVVTVTGNGGATTVQGYAGRYQGQFGNGPAVNIFCVDINHEIHDGDSFTANTQYNITSAPGTFGGTYYTGGFASALTNGDIASLTSAQATARAGEVAYLADTYLNATTLDANHFAALNLSIWDIVQDGGNGLTTGQVQAASSDVTAYGSLVSSYEAEAAGYTGYTSNTAGWIQAPESPLGTHFQDYVYEKPASSHDSPQAVPEPGITTFLFCMALAAGGFWLSRRKTAV